jgi:transposase
MNGHSTGNLSKRNEELEKENQSLRAEIERLRKLLEEALRSLKRQAAPFSKGTPKAEPKKAGRKPGAAYGKRSSRPVPTRVDEEIPVPLPERSPCCGATVIPENTQSQYQEDIVRRTIKRRFDVQTGRCVCCGRHVQGRHPLQTSDALGAACVQVGPQALAFAAHLNKQFGISDERVAQVLKWGFDLQIHRSTVCRAVMRLGKKVEPTYQQLRFSIRQSPLAWMDETGWRVAAHLQWLWVVVSEQVTVYDILPGRGFEQAASLLGKDWEGIVHHDGWAPYYKFRKALHQSCLAHILRRCHDMIQAAPGRAAGFPRKISELFKKALLLRDRFCDDSISLHGLRIARGRLEGQLDGLLDKTFCNPSNLRLANHLLNERPHLFTFLYYPGMVEPTDNTAERAIRPAVVARKTWGGNRTAEGAKVQRALMSVLRTCCQQGKDSFAAIVDLLRSQQQQILDIIPLSQSP